jgi:hypothetical protein
MFELIKPLICHADEGGICRRQTPKAKISEPRFGWIKKIYMMEKLLSQKTLKPQKPSAPLRDKI